MNFYRYYNIAINESHSYCIPALDSDDDIEVWGWSSGEGLPLQRWNEQEINFIDTWQDEYSQLDDDVWVTGDTFEKTCLNVQDLENLVQDLFEETPSRLDELQHVVDEFKQRVDPQYPGVYKIFGSPRHRSWWVCYILDAAALTKFKVNKINNALSNVKNNTELNKLFKK
jgi:hypothetical protein